MLMVQIEDIIYILFLDLARVCVCRTEQNSFQNWREKQIHILNMALSKIGVRNKYIWKISDHNRIQGI
jgi:hypothetical protein